MNTFEISRRNLLKTAVAGAAVGAMDVWNGRIGQATEAVKPQVGIAGYAYDRVQGKETNGEPQYALALTRLCLVIL